MTKLLPNHAKLTGDLIPQNAKGVRPCLVELLNGEDSVQRIKEKQQ